MSVCSGKGRGGRETEEGMEDGDAFLARLGNIHKAIHVNGQTVLDAMLRTLGEMLTDRGFGDVQVAEDPMKEMLAGRPVVRSSVCVFIHMEDRVGVKFARTLVEGSKGGQCVCVSIDGPTAFTKNEFHSKNIQFMLCKSLFVNITHHSLVPRHSLVADAGGIEKRLLPIILDSDPIVQYFNWPAGGIVKVERLFGGSEPLSYYRLIQAVS